MDKMALKCVLNLYNGKRVFITGHTGFKGAWMCEVLNMLGAKVSGFSLDPPTDPSLYNIAEIGQRVRSKIGDVRDLPALQAAMREFEPEIVFHLAAQPIVRESYRDPVLTYSTNVMGTVHLLESVRQCASVKSVINVTTDKVYQNKEWEWGYRENDRLNGFDPYSNSKSCSELVTDSYINSFFINSGVAVSTCRAGNVIGGGDFAKDRIIPDCVRAVQKGEKIAVRNPYSVRPYQHVLEPIFAYLLVAALQYGDRTRYMGSYNIGPDDLDCVSTGELVDLFCHTWGNVSWECIEQKNAPHEANFLRLDCSRVKLLTCWKPRWHVCDAIARTVEWSKVYMEKGNVLAVMHNQANMYLEA